VQLLTSKQGPAFIDFAQWSQADNADVRIAIRNLRGAVARIAKAKAQGAAQACALSARARAAPESIGEIQLIQEADAKLANDPGLSAMKGAAQYMMGRYGDARVSLSDGKLTADPHAALWRGMAEAKLGTSPMRGAIFRCRKACCGSIRKMADAGAPRPRRTGLAQGDLASANDALDQLTPQLTRANRWRRGSTRPNFWPRNPT